MRVYVKSWGRVLKVKRVLASKLRKVWENGVKLEKVIAKSWESGLEV